MFLKSKFYYIYLVVIGAYLVCGHDKTELVPARYDVRFEKVDMDNMFFEGSVDIGLNIIQEENKIKLNSYGLNISSVVVKWNGKMTVVSTYSITEKNERLEIHSDDSLMPGYYSIHIQYRGVINSKSMGFFKTPCRSGKGTSWIGGVSLEPVNARSVLPSFDVDEAKTPVVVNMTLKQEYRVIAHNVSITPLQRGLQNVILYFGDVHLNQVGWAIYPVDEIVKYETVKDTRQHKVLYCRYQGSRLDVVQSMSRELSEYQVPEISNIHWILMPDLPTPISSSLSINFIREHLVEASMYTSEADVYESLISVGEALSQQLFGQQITTSSWSDIWITKGLTTFFKYKLAQKIGKSYNINIENYIIGHVLPRVLEREKIPHSLAKHADTKDEVLYTFDEDLFDRAGLILNMIENAIGENSFKRAIANFMNATTTNGSAYPIHFWESVERVSLDFPKNRSVNDVMKPWINSGGYPIVYAKREGEWIILTQRTVLKHKGSKGYWWIPITVISKNMKTPRKFWLRPDGKLNIHMSVEDAWYIINQNGKGYYRVNYDLDNWKNLHDAMASGELNEIAKARLMDDALGLAEDGHLSYSVALGFTRLLSERNENNTPWSAAIRHLLTIRTLLEPSKRPLWDEYISTLIASYILGNETSLANVVSSSDNTSDDEVDATLKTAFNKMYLTQDLCRANMYCYDIVNDIIFQSQSLRTNYLYYGDMLDGALCLMIENGNETVWQNWFSRYSQNESPCLESKILAALSCTKDSNTLDRLLGMFFEELSSLKRQEFITFMSKISTTEITSRSAVLQVLGKHLSKLENYISGDDRMISNIALHLSEKIYDTTTITQVKVFLSTWEKSGDAKQDSHNQQINRGIRRLELNRNKRIKWSDEISRWLRNRNDYSIDFVTAASSATSFSLVLFSFILSSSFFLF